jgi:hypothetical protein
MARRICPVGSMQSDAPNPDHIELRRGALARFWSGDN